MGDVRSVVEAISTDNEDAPLYQVESLCMRCTQNVCALFFLILSVYYLFSFNFLVSVCKNCLKMLKKMTCLLVFSETQLVYC